MPFMVFTPEAWARMFSREDDTVDCTRSTAPVVRIDAMKDAELPDGEYGISMRFFNSPGMVRVKAGMVVLAPRKCDWARGKKITEVRDFVKQCRGVIHFQKAES